MSTLVTSSSQHQENNGIPTQTDFVNSGLDLKQND